MGLSARRGSIGLPARRGAVFRKQCLLGTPALNYIVFPAAYIPSFTASRNLFPMAARLARIFPVRTPISFTAYSSQQSIRLARTSIIQHADFACRCLQRTACRRHGGSRSKAENLQTPQPLDANGPGHMSSALRLPLRSVGPAACRTPSRSSPRLP